MDDDGEDDLFASLKSMKPKKEEEEEGDGKEEVPVKPPQKKKPAGAVSMFGGMDPFGAIAKKKPIKEDDGIYCTCIQLYIIAHCTCICTV